MKKWEILKKKKVDLKKLNQKKLKKEGNLDNNWSDYFTRNGHP